MRLKMLKMALVLTEDGAFALFLSSRIWQLKSPQPRELAIQGRKNAYVRVSAERGEGVRRLMHKLRNIFLLQLHNNLTV